MRRITVFCGSSMGKNPIYRESAVSLGATLARNGIGIVYGGARIGLMGAVADAVINHGGEAIGVIPNYLVDKEVAHKGLTKLHVVSSMHERKALMAELGDGFLALPGGFGTWEELIEAMTWGQLGLHGKPCVLLNIAGYYDSLLNMIEHSLSEGFITEIHKSLVISTDDPSTAINLMRNFKSPPTSDLYAHLRDSI